MKSYRWRMRYWSDERKALEPVVEIRNMDEGDVYVFTLKADGHIGEVGANADNLMQSSGMVDRDGNEIYEGDILQCVSDTRLKDLVVFENGKFTGRWYELHPKAGQANEWQIIGNRWENSELYQELQCRMK